MGTPPVFQTIDLHRTYRLPKHSVNVLKGVNLRVNPGEWVSLTGHSGCGKSTLLHLLGNLDAPTSGTVCFQGRPYARLGAGKRAEIRRRRIGFVFQAYHLFPELNALENVTLPARRWFNRGAKEQQRAIELLSRFGLKDRLTHRPQELSGGEQQRVAIARALINKPDVILADEPTGNLDSDAGKEILGILSDLHNEQGLTIVMVTHDAKIAGLAQRTYRLDDGVGQEVRRNRK